MPKTPLSEISGHALRHSPYTVKVYLYYRLILSALLFFTFFVGVIEESLGKTSERIYLWSSIGYLAICALSILSFSADSITRSPKHLHAFLIIDIVALLVLVHSSGGVESGIIYLLIISIAIVSIFAHGRIAFAYAAFIAIVILLDTLYTFQASKNLTRLVFNSGSFGILIFVTIAGLNYLTEVIRKTTEKADQQALHILNLQKIAQEIVSRMQTGLVVTDENLHIEQLNHSARLMLNVPDDRNLFGISLFDVKELQHIIEPWFQAMKTQQPKVIAVTPNMEIRVSCAFLKSDKSPKNIFYLEDYSAVRQQAQQLKLASLGRLAASIAHEIRNPLGALSHATQLLKESPKLDKADERLTEIILDNSKRINDIITNTQSLSRRHEPNPKQINLAKWLKEFIESFHKDSTANISLELLSSDLPARFDTTQLRQILTNLVDNGLRYSLEATGEAKVNIIAGLQETDKDKAYIEILDFGLGIPEEDQKHVFEPFFTTHEQGSGLGLYISRELTEINQATLHYKKTRDNISCFRIDFSHHRRIR